MKIAVVPDGAMIITHLITKNGHEYLSSTKITEEKLREKDPYDDSCGDQNLPPFSMRGHHILIGNKYTSNEVASGVRGRLSLFDEIIQQADAAIIMGLPPKNYTPIYNTLNELILFACVGCSNNYKLTIKLLKDKKIPILELKYPTTKEEIINLIERVNAFLQNLHEGNIENKIINEDKLTVDLKIKKEKISLDELNKIINEIKWL